MDYANNSAALALRPLVEADLEDMMAVLTHPEVGLTYMVPDLAEESARQRLFDRLCALSRQPGYYLRGITLEGRVIGLIHQVAVSGTEVEVGYALHPAWKNRGYTTRALSAALDALFAMGYSRVIAGAFEGNAPSFRVMEKCGMTPLDRTDAVSYRGRTHTCRYRQRTAPRNP